MAPPWGLELRGEYVVLWCRGLKAIRRGWDSFSPHCSFKVGKGDRVKFWRHRWCGEEPLEVAFPPLSLDFLEIKTCSNGCLKMEGDGVVGYWT